MTKTPAFHAHVVRYPDPTPLDAEGNDEHGMPIVDLDAADIAAAIEAEGWCGTFTLRGDAAVVVLFGEALPKAARAYLRAGR